MKKSMTIDEFTDKYCKECEFNDRCCVDSTPSCELSRKLDIEIENNDNL